MKRKIRIPEPGVRVSIGLITLALAAVGVMQFIWFRQSAADEVEGARRSLFNTVSQTFAREYQRYAPLIESLRLLAAEGKGSSQEARISLGRLYGLYGPEGSLSGLVASVGLAEGGDPAETATLEADGSWGKGPSAFPLPMPELALGQLAEGKLLFYEGRGAADRQYILARAGRSSIAVVAIDPSAFFDTYIKPSIASALPGALIEWAETSASDKAKNEALAFRDGKQNSDFNPALVLLGLKSRERRTFTFSIPVTIDAYLMRNPASFGEEGGGDDRRSNYRPLQGFDEHGPWLPFQAKSASIVMPEGSAMATMELRLSLNWLLSVLFLVGIGLAFAQTMVQKHKLKSVSEREREFVASVTHELRTPVTVIRTAAGNMREGLIAPERLATYEDLIYFAIDPPRDDDRGDAPLLPSRGTQGPGPPPRGDRDGRASGRAI